MRYRCDEPMRRSKERCYTPLRKRWRCNLDCRSCPCCIIIDDEGNEKHLGSGKILEGLHERIKE